MWHSKRISGRRGLNAATVGALGALLDILRLWAGVVEIHAPKTLKQKPLHRRATDLGAAADIDQFEHACAPRAKNNRHGRAAELLCVGDIEQRQIAEKTINLLLFGRFRGRRRILGLLSF